jgi:hypothetical protein
VVHSMKLSSIFAYLDTRFPEKPGFSRGGKSTEVSRFVVDKTS